MSFDLILDEIGEFGVWQVLVCGILWVPPMVGGIHVLMYSFTGFIPEKFRCQIPGCDQDNFTFTDYNPSDIFPRDEDGDYDYCFYRTPTINTDGSCSFNNEDPFISCPDGAKFAYGEFEFKNTLVTELNLVCGEEGKVAWVGSAYMFGLMVGSFLCGFLADKFGRKIALLIAIIISSSGSLVGAFMPEYYSYLISRFVTAIGAQGVFLAPFSMTVEIVGGQKALPFLPFPVKYKTAAGNMIQAPFAIGMALLSVLASFIGDWRTLQWTVSLATFAQLILLFIIPESPRWLIAAGRNKAAKKVIEAGARRNGVKNYVFNSNPSLPIETQVGEGEKREEERSSSEYGLKDMFHPTLRYISIILMICWPIVTLGYYGITFSMANLNDDTFVSFIVSSLVEIPAYIVVTLFMDVWGRKPLFSLSLISSGALCMACGLLEEGTTKTVLAMFGKFFASSSFALVYMFTAELFPTTIRSSAVGICSLMARIGGISAPQIAIALPKVTSDAAPFFVMGGCSIFGGILSLLLPETLGSNLPETFEDVENIKKNAKPIWKCVSYAKAE